MGKQSVGQRRQEADTNMETDTEFATGARTKTGKGKKTDEPVVQKMFLELQKGIAAISSKLDEQAIHTIGLQTAVDGIKERLNEAERKISSLEQVTKTLIVRLQKSERLNEELQTRTNDLEGRSRRNNLRLVGIAETAIVGNVPQGVEILIKQLFGMDQLSPFFAVERAHRALAPKPKPGDNPRPIIVKLLNYRDRDTILRLAREKGKLTYEGMQISFYPDFALSVLNARRAFDHIKGVLRQKKVPYSMLFPAKLRVVWKEDTKFFTDPLKAAEYVAAHIAPVPDPMPKNPWVVNRRRRKPRKRRHAQQLRWTDQTTVENGEHSDEHGNSTGRDSTDSESLLPT